MPEDKSLQAFIFVIGWIALGLLPTFLFKWILDDIDGVLLTTLLIAPIFIFVILSDRLSEFSAPGGWSAKFQEAASTSISLGQDEIIEISKINHQAKGNL